MKETRTCVVCRQKNNKNQLIRIAKDKNCEAIYDKEKIKVYADYNDGGYVEYMGIKSYIDPRAEVFLKKNNKQKDIFVEYYNVQKYKLPCDVFLNTYDFDLLILDEQDALNKCMNNKKYNLVYSDKDRKLYEVKK